MFSKINLQILIYLFFIFVLSQYFSLNLYLFDKEYHLELTNINFFNISLKELLYSVIIIYSYLYIIIKKIYNFKISFFFLLIGFLLFNLDLNLFLISNYFIIFFIFKDVKFNFFEFKKIVNTLNNFTIILLFFFLTQKFFIDFKEFFTSSLFIWSHNGLVTDNFYFHFINVTNSFSYFNFLIILVNILLLKNSNNILKEKKFLIICVLNLFIINTFLQILLLSTFSVFFYFCYKKKNNQIFQYKYNNNIILSILIIICFLFFYIIQSDIILFIIHKIYFFVLYFFKSLLGFNEASICGEYISNTWGRTAYTKDLQLKYPVICFSFPGEPPFYGAWLGFVERIGIIKWFIAENNFSFTKKLSSIYYTHNSYLNLLNRHNFIVYCMILMIFIFIILKLSKPLDLFNVFFIFIVFFSHINDDYLFGNKVEISLLSFKILGLWFNAKLNKN